MSTDDATVGRPFTHMALERRSLLQILTRGKSCDNAWIEVNNLLADAPEVRSVRPEQVARIADRYRLPLRGEFCGRLEALYREYLLYCLADRRLTSDEMSDLAHLKRIFRLNDRALSAIHETVARQLYSRGISELLIDPAVHPEEREFLYALQQCLGMPARAAERSMAAQRGETTG